MNSKSPSTSKLSLLLIGACMAIAAVLPASASADSATLINAQRITDTQFGANFNVTFDTCEPGDVYCGWFPTAHWVNASTVCPSVRPTNQYVWVGNNQDAMGTQTGGGVFSAPATTGAINFCVYVYYNGVDKLTATIPWGGAANPAALSSKQAITYTKTVLNKKLGKRFKKGKSKRVSCRSVNETERKCSVSFKYKGKKYKGTTTVRHYFIGTTLNYSVLYSIRQRS
jgi:hypothetical protein